MSSFGPELSPNDAPALPMWIDGRAYLMMATEFQSVTNAKGQAVRRVPLYGAEAVAVAVQSTEQAVSVWRAQSVDAREQCFRQLHELLARYRGHFCGLIEDEAGFSHELAEAELEQSLAAIAGPVPELHAAAGVAAVASDGLAPLAAPLRCAVEALAAGWGVVLKPSAKAPSALFACAELFSRAGFPAGLVNCVQGDEQAMLALCAHPAIAALAFVGGESLSRRVGELAAADNKAHVSGAAGGELQKSWRTLLGYQE